MSRVRADRYTNREGTGAPTFSQGVNIVGMTSITGVGSTALLVNGDARVTGVLTVGQGSVTISGDSISGVTTAGITSAYVNSINNLNYPTAGPLSNRNLIINGAMDVWQRGTSQTVSGSYGADRFWMANASSAARSTDAPAGFTYSTKLTYSASDMSMGQPIELPATGQQGQLAAGITVTLSYYAKVDSGTEGIQTTINFRDSKFSSTNQVAFTSSNANATWTTTWTRYEHQFTVPTVAGTNVLAGLEIAGISKDAYITGLQLEVGERATPFEHRSYGQELALCQRYYYKFRCSNQEWIYNEGTSANTKWHQIYIGHSMRANPSVDVTDLTTGGSVSGMSGVTISSISPQTPGNTPGRISSRVIMSGTSGSAYNLYHTDSWNSDYIALSSEL